MINALPNTLKISWSRLPDGFAGPAAESRRSSGGSAAARWPAIEPLEARLLLSGDMLLTAPLQGDIPLAGMADVQKLIVVGSPRGRDRDSPSKHVDANTTDSPYAGVGSLRVDATGFDGYTYIGSATAISRFHVLTAAHMFDLDDDGDIDVAPGDVEFNLNFGSDLSHVIAASALSVHPDWTGFMNPVPNDDVAVVELSTALPDGVPIYPLDADPFIYIDTVTMVGYGLSGDGVRGYDLKLGTSWSVKRVGYNRTDMYMNDDEYEGPYPPPPEAREVWRFDFDGPTAETNLWGVEFPYFGTLGNELETTLGGGDSGGPAFIDDGAGGLEVFGINTYGFSGVAPVPLFGSGGGGMVVAPYVDWINSVVGDVPGITVTPRSGLQTDEAGVMTATFTVVLDSQPAADVVIGLSSSDTGEGDVDQTSLVFTPGELGNWNVPQTVTVTGVDDGESDGNVPYTIITAAAVSDDPDYDGVNPADVAVTNIDDEAPAEILIITKATYSSRKQELKVEATSSLGGDPAFPLTATFFVGQTSVTEAMSYNAKKDKWSVTFTSVGVKPDMVRVCSTSTGACVEVEQTDIGGKSIPVAAGHAVQSVAASHAIQSAATASEGPADQPDVLPLTDGTPVSTAAPRRGRVSVPLTLADLPPLAAYSAFMTTDSEQSTPPQQPGPAPSAVQDASADNELAGETNLPLNAIPSGDELLDKLHLGL